MEKQINLTCPRCRGTMEYNKEKSEFLCPYCRYKIIIKEEESLEEAIIRAKKISYAKADGVNLAEEAAEKRKHLNKIKGKLIITTMIFGIIIFLMFIIYLSHPKIDNPFNGVDITFSGTNGEGTLNLSVNNEYEGQIRYLPSKDYNLSNNDKIFITAESKYYRLKNNVKEITVQGLYNYLENLDELTPEMIDYIHKLTYDFQKKKFESSYSVQQYKKKIDSIDLQPYKIYLSKNNNKNLLDVIYILKIRVQSGNEYQYYVDTCFENVILIKEDNDLIRYKDITHKGKNINIGGSLFTTKDYLGAYTGFKTPEDADNYIRNNSDVTMKVQEKVDQ